jgi:predicted MPP superfamily phosphohydrolase
VLRLLHVSDVHLSPGQQHRVDFLASLGELEHDLVVATGDLLGSRDMEDETAAALAPLTSAGRPGLVVLGSHDLFAPSFRSPFGYFTGPSDTPDTTAGHRLRTDRFLELLGQHGYTTLRGEAVAVPTAAGTVLAGGFDDPHLSTTVLPAPDEVSPDAARRASRDHGGATGTGGEPALLHLGVVHAPYRAALDVLVDAGHDLLLAGHTHGGQVRLPGIGALVANCDLPLDQARGLSRYRDRWLHVSAGLGHSPYAPFRFACRPEATLLELTG